MFHPAVGDLNQLNQPRGPVTSLKEEPLGANRWVQPDQTKWVELRNKKRVKVETTSENWFLRGVFDDKKKTHATST